MTTWEQCPTCGEWENPQDNPEAWRLAKAAPDLLVACVNIIFAAGYSGDTKTKKELQVKTLVMVEAAIAKARGE